jgi:hypothetical protein
VEHAPALEEREAAGDEHDDSADAIHGSAWAARFDPTAAQSLS